MSKSWEIFLAAALQTKKENTSFRTLKTITHRNSGQIQENKQQMFNFGSNDYLGLAQDKRVIEAGIKAAQKWGAGSQSSRLLTGTLENTTNLEKRFANWVEKEAALLFNSGFTANIGLITALANKDTIIYSDRLNHASIYDGIMQSKAELRRYKHTAVTHLKELLEKDNESSKRKIIITEALFSMDGDIAPLAEISKLAKEYQALFIVDEAHSIGIFGKQGKGLVNSLGITTEVDILVCPLGKSFGAMGAFIAGNQKVIDFLINYSRPFIYSTALSPFLVGAIDRALSIIETENRGENLLKLAADFRRILNKQISTKPSESQIIPIMVKTNEKALDLMAYLKNNNYYAPAVRPPTVPVNQARIRLSLCYFHPLSDLEKLAKLIFTWLPTKAL